MFGKFWPSFEIDRANARRSILVFSRSYLSFIVPRHVHTRESPSEISELFRDTCHIPLASNQRSIEVRDDKIDTAKESRLSRRMETGTRINENLSSEIRGAVQEGKGRNA